MKIKIKFYIFFIFIFLIIIGGIFCFWSRKNDKKEIINEEVSNNIVQKELFADYYDEAEKLMENMTIEEKVGQMFITGYFEVEEIEEIKKYNPGGYILYEYNFKEKTPETLIEELKGIQEDSKIKLLIGVDEEGGRVTRISKYKAFRDSQFLSMQQLYKIGGLYAIIEDSREKSEFLKELWLNMNLAPVVDITKNKDSYIYDRTYGKSIGETALFARKIVETMNESKMISVVKHFPGYGDNLDTHTGVAIDNRSYETIKKEDLLPFKSAIRAKAPCILVSHNIVKSIDEERPASLSEKVIKILREELKFSGIIMTDDLSMDAIKNYDKVAVQAVLAGNDIIISANFKEQRQEILTAIKEGEISEDIINIAVKRILALKYAYGIL